MSLPVHVQARHIYADTVARRGSAWLNSAHNIRAGTYSNCWIEAGVDAIETALRKGAEDQDDEPDAARA